MNLFLLPGTNENLAKSIYQSVSNIKLEQNLTKDLVSRINQNLQGQPIHCWAFGNDGHIDYDNMNDGSVMLFKEKGNDSFCIKGEYADKVRSSQFGQALWGAPWEFIFFIKNISRISIPISRLRDVLDYDDRYWLPGAIKVADSKVINAIRKFGTFEKLMDYFENGKKSTERTIIRRKGTGTLQSEKHVLLSNNVEDSKDDPWKI